MIWYLAFCWNTRLVANIPIQLGVPVDADDNALKKAYRKQAMKVYTLQLYYDKC